MSNKTVSYTAQQLRDMQKQKDREWLRYRLTFYMIIVVVGAVLAHITEAYDTFSTLAIIGLGLLFLVEYSLWKLPRAAQDKRNAMKVRLFAYKRDASHIIADADGMNADGSLPHVYDADGYAMTPGDINRLAIQIRDAMNITNKLKAKQEVNKLVKGVKGVTKSELIQLVKDMDHDELSNQAQEFLDEEFSKTSGRIDLRNVQYAPAPTTNHPELVNEAGRLGMSMSQKEIRVGNGFVQVTAFNHEGADIFGADAYGDLYVPHGTRWTEVDQAHINDMLDDLRKMVTP